MRKIESAELQQILASHGQWLRFEKGGTRANLHGANLGGASLHGANLDRANLHGANLDRANLDRANLDRANLHGASLHGANLHGASLDRANLHGASLHGASLHGAILHGANLGGASLNGANLDRANLHGANLDRANLHGASLNGAILHGASLHGANLNGAILHGASLHGANLTPIRDDFWAVLSASPSEVEGLRLAIIEGRIDGATYEGDCACLVGTLAKIRHCHHSKIPGLTPNSDRPAERFFLAISRGDTPQTSQFSKIALGWTDEWIAGVRAPGGHVLISSVSSIRDNGV